MDLVFVLVALVAIGLPVAVVVLIVVAVRQGRRVQALEEEMAQARAAFAALARRQAPGTGTEPEPIPTAEDAAAQAAPETAAPDPGPAPTVLAETAPAPEARGPWHGKASAPASPAPASDPQGPSRAGLLFAWLRENWFYAVSALSLALAGVFLVQYSVENSLLPPSARVIAAALFGLALIAGGEVIRRRYGDGEDSATAYLPSVFSGAGIVSLFGAVIAARMLYGLIGPTPAFAALVLVALMALVLGWFHGPLLATVGLIGGFAAPFLVGGDAEASDWLFAYFAALTLLGLGIDTVRRWRWVSVLTLALAYGVGTLLRLADDMTRLAFTLYLPALLALAVLVPVRRLVPDHHGPSWLDTALTPGSPRPGFAPMLALGASVLSAALLVLNATAATPEEAWLTLALLTAAAGVLTLASRGAPGLQDAALPPALALLVLIGWGDTIQPLLPPRLIDLPPETGPGWAVPAVLIAAVLISLAAAWRSLRGGATRILWALIAAGFAPAAALILEWVWQPALRIGAYPWALDALALAAVMTALAPRFAKADGEDRTRVSLFALSALGCIAFAPVILLSKSALTVALAALIPSAAVLDRRFNLPLMEYAIAAAVVAVGYRLVADPGIGFALRAGWADFALAYGGALLAMIAGLVLLREGRLTGRVMLDTGAWSAAGLLASLTLHRVLDARLPDEGFSHWSLGLHATVWLGLMAVQLSRAERLPMLRWLRRGLAALFGLIAAGALVLGVVALNPLFTGTVHGWPLLNTLAPAYLLPAVVLAGIGWRILPGNRIALALAGALTALWAGLVIRHVWQGGAAMRIEDGLTQPELYSYTVALLVLGAAVVYQAIARRSDLLRRVGSGLIALAVAKVFLIDISGLSGLTRVFSLVLLGLSLAGLAWLNRWAQGRAARSAGPD